MPNRSRWCSSVTVAAGIVISAVAEARPDQIDGLVYLCAFLPRSGESLIQLAQTDEESLILPNLAVDEEQGYHTLMPEQAWEILYGEAPTASAERAVARLRAEPNAPTFTPLHLTPGNFERVPRYYIRCTRDRAVGSALQDRMAAASPCRKVFTLDTDHSPFYSAPAALAPNLLAIMEDVKERSAREEASTIAI